MSKMGLSLQACILIAFILPIVIQTSLTIKTILTTRFCQNFTEQIRQLVKVTGIVNIFPSNFLQLSLKIFILANSNRDNVNIFCLWAKFLKWIQTICVEVWDQDFEVTVGLLERKKNES